LRLATLIVDHEPHLVICEPTGFFRIADIDAGAAIQWPTEMDALIQSERLADLNAWYQKHGKKALTPEAASRIGVSSVRYAPLLRNPHKIWGIGLNYRDHARDLSETVPTLAPASFMKPDTAIIGLGDAINIPTLSRRTTAEAELGIVIGKRCKDVSAKNWLSVVAGFTTIIDMTAEDILKQNPRYLTVSKSFDTFISIGPQLVTPDEIDDVHQLAVATIINDAVHAENTVAHMTFPPEALIAYHSKVMTLLPGDIISTGTPGAVPIQHGDRVACRITGFETLHNPVVDLKNEQAAGRA
jgi:2-keto-4-pentenoate hydratase/2-oxohepta-3-ene-1,7-dioic acid hydratase in catechol pathway